MSTNPENKIENCIAKNKYIGSNVSQYIIDNKATYLLENEVTYTGDASD